MRRTRDWLLDTVEPALDSVLDRVSNLDMVSCCVSAQVRCVDDEERKLEGDRGPRAIRSAERGTGTGE